MELVQVMKALSDETRIRIVNLLQEGDLCVCELEVLLDINQSNASRHLNRLTNAHIVDYYKVAKYVYYKLIKETICEFPFIEEIIIEHAKKLSICNEDNRKLKKYKASGLNCDNLKDGLICFNC